jgi:hypothetical protein
MKCPVTPIKKKSISVKRCSSDYSSLAYQKKKQKIVMIAASIVLLLQKYISLLRQMVLHTNAYFATKRDLCTQGRNISNPPTPCPANWMETTRTTSFVVLS